MIIRNFYEDKLAQASYLVGCAATGEAIVIDPLRDIHLYLEAAELLGLRISAVTETHIHADFLSGTRELSASTGAKIFLSGEGGAEWQYSDSDDPNVELLHDGNHIHVGNLSLKAIHVPGHTPEHLAFLLTDHPTSSLPHSLFAGDFVFVGDVGRPDLLERAANVSGTMEAGAKSLFRSLKKLNDLPDSVLVWPGHGAGSACGKSLGGSPVSSIGYERRTNWAFLVSNEAKFVEEILAGQPDPPLYFREMKRLNKLGPSVLRELPRPAHVKTARGQLIDVRPAEVIRAGSCDDAIDIPSGKAFTTWAGWLLRYDEPVTMIAENQASADRAARDLATIGLDSVRGWIDPSVLGRERFIPVQSVSCRALDRAALILDVRGTNERAHAHLPGSTHIPFGHLPGRIGELPRDRDIVVHCASGARSLLAYSILRQGGFKRVSELSGGLSAVEADAPELLSAR